MTTITMKEVAAFLLGEAPLDGAWFGDTRPSEHGQFWWRKHLRDALSAPATAPEKTVKEIMEFVRHYATNTFSSATLEDKIRRSLTAPATAPAWNNVPTCEGLWLCDEGDENPYRFTCHDISMPLNPHLVGEGERWYGPIPEDRQ